MINFVPDMLHYMPTIPATQEAEIGRAVFIEKLKQQKKI
jgi:hypothetical protein